MCEQGPIANTDQSQTNFLLILHTFLPMRVLCSHFHFLDQIKIAYVHKLSPYVSVDSARTVVQAPCQINFGLVSSSAPGAPSSRPYPEALKPPNGARGSERVKSLINTIPDSISPATRRALTRSRLQTAALRPKSVILAMRIASSSVLKGKIIATGPKNSSLAIAASGGSPTSTVGG